PVDAVLLARVEPERVQLALELADVIAPERGRVSVQGAVAQTEPGLRELHPRIRPDEPVDAQVSELLERPDGGFRGGPECPGQLTGRERVAQRGQTLLDVEHLRAVVARAEHAHGSSVRRRTGRGKR